MKVIFTAHLTPTDTGNTIHIIDFKPIVVSSSGHLHQSDNSVDGPAESVDTDYEFETLSGDDTVGVDLPKSIDEKVACILLKLENIVHIPKSAVDEVLSELHYILSTASIPITKAVVSDLFQSHNIQVEESVVDELSTVICTSNPLAELFLRRALL